MIKDRCRSRLDLLLIKIRRKDPIVSISSAISKIAQINDQFYSSVCEVSKQRRKGSCGLFAGKSVEYLGKTDPVKVDL